MARTGRPPKPKGDQKDCLITLRLTADEAKAVDRAAAQMGKNRSEWVRKILTAALNVIQ